MVKQFVMAGLLIPLFMPAVAMAEDEKSLQASVNRTELHANETLRLEVEGKTELDFSLGSLFQIRDLDLPMPDTTALEEQFEIVDLNQRYSVRSVNGEHNAEITWIYLLAPRESGDLTIPPLTFEGNETAPISIRVLSGVAPDRDRPENRAELEAVLSEDEVYVRQQLLLTQRLSYIPPLIRGNLPAPEIEGAQIQKVDEQEEYEEERNGRQWQVVERRYLVIPEQPGTLDIPEQQFQGRKRDADGEVVFLRANTPPMTVSVAPPPQGFSGDTWLPATSLDISEEWSKSPETLRAGDSITRTLRIRALGLVPEALPRVEMNYPESLREYPDPWESQSRLTNETLESTLEKSAALVPIEPGQAYLPEIRIPWWDVVEDVERTAVIQGRNVYVEPAGGGDSQSTQVSDEELPATGNSRPPGAQLPAFWVWLATALATGWLITGVAWWRNRQRAFGNIELSPTERANRERFRALCISARNGDADTLVLLPQWASAHFNKPGLKTVADVKAYLNDPQLTREIEALERRLFAQPDQRQPWDGEQLVEALRRLSGQPQPRQA